MAFRSHALLKTMINNLRGRSATYATSANSEPIRSSYVPAAAMRPKDSLLPTQWRKNVGDLVPVCVALGMIGVASSFGLHTAMQQLKRAPNVLVNKSRRRERLPELVEPERVADQSNQFINRSFFRKVARIKNATLPSSNASPHVETLKSVGVVDPLP